MSFELTSSGTSPPSCIRRESLVHLLESCKDSLEVLGKELGIDTTQCKEVCEVLDIYEENVGQELSLDKWMVIFERLGCLVEFKMLLVEDQLLDDVNTLDDCPPNDCDDLGQGTLFKESKELRHQKIKANNQCSSLTLPGSESSLPSKPGDNVEETWKASPELGLPPPLEDETSTVLVKDSIREAKGDDEEHPYLDAGKASEGMLSSDGQSMPENRQTIASGLPAVFNFESCEIQDLATQFQGAAAAPVPYCMDLGEESHAASLINEGDVLSSGKLRSISKPVNFEAINSPSSVVTGYQFRPNDLKAGKINAVDQDGQNLHENRRMSCVSPLLAEASSLTAIHQFQEATPSHTSGTFVTEDNRSLSQIEIDPSHQAVRARSLPAMRARSAMQDSVGPFHQATATDTFGTDQAEDSSTSSQSDTDVSLSSDDLGTQLRPFTPPVATSPQSHRLHPNNLIAGEVNLAVNHEGAVLNRGVSLGAQLSPAIGTSILPTGYASSVVQDPVCQIHQDMAHAIPSTDEEESSSSSSESHTDVSLLLHDSNDLGQGTGKQPSENDDATHDQHMNILQQVQPPLQLGEIAFLIQSLWKKTAKHEACKQDLQHSRQQCAQLQTTIDELQRYLDNSNHLQHENQRLIGMTQEMCELKDQEIQQLRLLCEQKDQIIVENESHRGEQIQMHRQIAQRHESHQQQVERLERESQERSEELRQATAEVQQLQESERLRLENERLSDQRMTELSEAFFNSQTDEVKILERELGKEKHKRTEAEKTNRCLSEENCQLQSMVNELMSRLAKLVEVPCSAPSPDTVQENLVSSSTDLTVHVVEADEESDDDKEVFEDALDHL